MAVGMATMGALIARRQLPSSAMAGELGKRNAPEGYFNAEIESKRTPIVSRSNSTDKGAADIAVVVKRGGKDKCPSCVAFGDPK